MSQEYIEITERTVSEAITTACQKLAVPSERLEYEVIDPGKTGFLGIGSRAAKIRARVKQGMEESTEFNASAIISDVLKGKEDKSRLSDQHAKEKKKEDKKESRKKDSSRNAEKVGNERSGSDKAGAKKTSVSVKEEKHAPKEASSFTEKKAPAEKEKPAYTANTANAAEKAESAGGNNSGRKGSGRRDTGQGIRFSMWRRPRHITCRI